MVCFRHGAKKTTIRVNMKDILTAQRKEGLFKAYGAKKNTYKHKNDVPTKLSREECVRGAVQR